MDNLKITEFDKKIMNTLSRCEDITNINEYYAELRTLSYRLQEDETLLFLNQIFHVLGNHDRIIILQALAEKDRCACEFEAIIHKSQPAISRDLKRLEEIGLIRGWKKGAFIHYSLVKQTFDKFIEKVNKWVSSFNNWFG